MSSRNKNRSRQGFTVLELIVFVAIFSFTIVGFISILVSITKVQVKQGSSAEVSQQSQYVLQTLQYYVERSSLIEAEANTASSSIKLRMSTDAEDPTLIYSSGTTVYIKVGTGPVLPLTSNRVAVSNMTFTKKANGPAKDSVSIGFTISYNTQNFQQQFSQAFSSAVMRVNAATFDSNVNPNGANLKLGDTGAVWKSINDAIYFNGQDVGISISSPAKRLHVAGGDAYISDAGSGIILKSPSGSCFKLAVTDGGAATTTAVGCP